MRRSASAAWLLAVATVAACASRAAAAATTSAARSRHGSFLAAAAKAKARLGIRATAALKRQAPLVPLPNDTVTPPYWAEVDAAIAAAEANQPAPTMHNSWPTSKPHTNSWTSVFDQNKNDFTASDLTQQDIANATVVNVINTPPPNMAAMQAETIQSLANIVPLNLQVGARVMYSLTDNPTGTPPPSQQSVNQQFVAQCPMIMFNSGMQISAPRCGYKGVWSDPLSGRTILRWNPDSGGDGYGGVKFGVDSIISGNGSVLYASANQQFSLGGTYFKLENCLNVLRYTIKEEVLSVNHLGAGVTSSIQAHDTGNTGQAYFYKYTIVNNNGTAVAETSLYRSNQDTVTITQVQNEVSTGHLIATATKTGSWTGDQWGDCEGAPHLWTLKFALTGLDVDMPTTVMDIRVATAATFTLMAYRSMNSAKPGSGGVSRQGEHLMIVSIVKALVIIILVLAFCIGGGLLVKKGSTDKRMRTCCFKFEAIYLPRRPLWQRTAPFRPTY